MAAVRPPSLIGLRDRALLVRGFAGAFRRSELLALEVADLIEVPDGLRVVIRRSKTDQEGAGQEIAILRGYHLCPVETVQTWLAAAEISAGPVFRQVNKGGRVSECPLGDDGYVRAIERRAGDLDAAEFSGHSLRAGFLTNRAPTCLRWRRSRGIAAWTRCGGMSGAAICSRGTRGPGSYDRHHSRREAALPGASWPG